MNPTLSNRKKFTLYKYLASEIKKLKVSIRQQPLTLSKKNQCELASLYLKLLLSVSTAKHGRISENDASKFCRSGNRCVRLCSETPYLMNSNPCTLEKQRQRIRKVLRIRNPLPQCKGGHTIIQKLLFALNINYEKYSGARCSTLLEHPSCVFNKYDAEYQLNFLKI